MRAKQIELPVSLRMEVGKGAAKRLRKSGRIPAVIYGRGMESQPLSVDTATFAHAIAGGVWFSTVIKLHIEGAKKADAAPTSGGSAAATPEGRGSGAQSALVMITEVQRDLARGRILSVDFHRISLRETVRAHVPILPIGQSPGVRLGGILEQILHEVEVECLPTNLPDHLEVDVAQLGIGDVVRAKDLTPPPGVRLLAPDDETILLVAPPVRIEEAPAAAPAEAAVIAETQEPEVIRQRAPEE
jgi:large subunit ribosomal protein L25